MRGRYVIVDPATASTGGTTPDGALMVERGLVSDLGPYSVLKARYPDAVELGSDRHVVMPGLVNAHHHGRGLSGLQLGIIDGYLESWLLDFWLQRPLDVFLDTMFANIRLLRSGVTTVVHSGYSRDWSQTANEAHAALRAYDESGLRVAFAPGVEDQNTFVLGDNEAFLASLPPSVAARVRAALFRLGGSPGYDYFALVDELAERYADHPRVKILYGPTGAEWCSPSLLRRIGERARADGLGIHMHCLESAFQHEFAWREHGMSSVAQLHDVGVLGPTTSLGHGTWVSDDDIARCADLGVSICHNASSNLRLRNGVAPVARMLERGVNVGIGMDGWAINSDDDMFQEMRLVSYLHRMPRAMRPAPAPTALDVLTMATVGGAAPSMFGDKIGRLDVGSFADIVLLDLEALGAPYLDPRLPLAEAIVGLGRASHVDTVMVGGDVLVAGGVFTGRDERALAAEIALLAEQPLPEHLQEFHDAITELKPFVNAFYDAWPPAAQVDPIYSVNTRS